MSHPLKASSDGAGDLNRCVAPIGSQREVNELFSAQHPLVEGEELRVVELDS